MKSRSRLALVAATSLGVSMALGMSATSLAQEEDTLDVIIVQAPIQIERSVDRAASSGSVVETEIVELTRKVNFEDLDLSRSADVKELEERIRQVAEDSCQRLAEMFPFDDSSIQGVKRCARRAIEDALEQTETAIASLQE